MAEPGIVFAWYKPPTRPPDAPPKPPISAPSDRPSIATYLVPSPTCNLAAGLAVPMPTLPVDEMKIVEVACAIPASLPTRKLPLVRFMPAGRSPVAFVRVSADGVPSAGVTRVGEVPRTTSPVPVQVKSEEVASAAKSAVAPVTYARTVFAAPCVRLANGRTPVTPVESGSPVALGRVTDVGVPRIGVTRGGLGEGTMFPVPVPALGRVTPP